MSCLYNAKKSISCLWRRRESKCRNQVKKCCKRQVRRLKLFFSLIIFNIFCYIISKLFIPFKKIEQLVRDTNENKQLSGLLCLICSSKHCPVYYH